MTERAVTNSTCLIALERIGLLGVLPQVFSTVFAPPAVQTELGNPVDWLEVKAIKEPRVVAVLRTQLDEGEAQTIALAMELGEIFVILDDKKARRIAQQIGLKVTGTIGVLLRAKRIGAIESLRPALSALQEAGFHMAAELNREALRLAGEESSQ